MDNFSIVFSKDTGNAENYRIPSVVVTKDGTLVAAADERFFTGADNPNRIDKVVRISEDGGKTWSEQITAVQMVGKDKKHSAAAIDPAMLYDAEQDAIFMLYSMTPAGIGILNCKKGTGYENGARIVTGNGKKFLWKDGEMVDESGSEKYAVAEDGTWSGGNVLTGEGGYKLYETSFLMMIRSDDHGKTWSKPLELNPSVKGKNWHFIGSGPANGIQLRHGEHAGRLIFPIYYGLGKLPMKLTTALIYSDDGGKTWSVTDTPPIRGRYIGKENPLIFPMRTYLTESQVVELDSGELVWFLRNHHPKRLIMVSRSLDSGITWTEPVLHEQLPQCVCQITALRVEENGKEAILTINAADPKKRRLGTARLSFDGGKTFPRSMVITDGEFVYSSAAQLPDGTIAVLFEDCTKHENIKFTTFALSEVK